ncbi:MAG: hypothetical protein ACRD12_13485 [Acidimicrobiales bacterium]
MTRTQTRAVAAIAGTAVPIATWLAFVPWDLEGADAIGLRLLFSVGTGAIVGGAIAYGSRPAGQAFVPAACVTTLVLFAWRASAAADPFWPLAVELAIPAAVGAYVIAFGIARIVRTGSAMT